jgi:MFS family permease
MPLKAGASRKLGILWALYFVQGLPFGFQATALPIYLRESGMSLAGVGLATALSIPWMLKIFWGPLVDRFGSERFGRRRSWILPLQLALAVACALAAFVSPDEQLTELLLLVLLMALCAATLDVAVDGLAVDLLAVRELGKGNIAQVVGYKIGMLTGGGLLVWASGRIGWEGLFFSMAILVALTTFITLSFNENEQVAASRGRERTRTQPRIGEILALLKRSLATRSSAWLLLFIGTYKLGENMADTMFKPFLVDAGFAAPQIGLWVGTWGMLFSIAGSVAGGYLASRGDLLRAVGITATLRAVPVAGEWWLTLVEPTASRVIAVTCAEHFFGGALTTAMFAFMMSRVDKRIGATHFTLLAAVEVWGKVPAAWVSGFIAQATSYSFLFGLAFVLSVAYLGLLIPLRKYAGEPPGLRSSEPVGDPERAAPAPASRA